MKKYILFFFLFSYQLFAQEVTVQATADSTNIKIGEWLLIVLEAKHPSNVALQWQALKDTLGPFEIVRQDTAFQRKEENGIVTESKNIIISKFEGGTFSIPPITVQYKKANDTTQYTAQTNPIPIEVTTVAVDTTSSFKDIKPPLSVPMSWKEILLYVGIVLAIALLGYGIFYYYKKRKKKVENIVEEKEEEQIPAEILALQKLQELETQKLWQKGEIKLFYSKTTEIIREYFEKRYSIMALELTSGEVLQQLKKFLLSKEMSKEIMQEIENLFTISDLVKFAKYTPVLSENEKIIPQAKNIVEQTKPVIVEKPIEKPMAERPVEAQSNVQ